MEFSGRLAAFPPAELLQWANNERRTGSLVFRRSRRQKRVFFEKGEVVACLSDDPADYYGQHLQLYGYLTESKLVDALSHCTRSGKRLGLALTELELLSRKEVRRTLAQQISDSVCGLFLWNHGVFFFEEDAPPREEILPEPIQTMGLVLEGTRWIDDFARFRRVFPHDNIALRKGPAWPGGDLAPVEARIAEVIDGERSLAKIHWRIKGSYFRILEAAYQMCIREILDISTIGEPLETTSLEINVYDLLLEQAVEEQVAMGDRSPSLSMGVVGGLRPVWTQTLSRADLATLPAELQALARRFDGRLQLSELLPETRGDHAPWDFFVEYLRKGNLALVPNADLASRLTPPE